MIKGGSIMRKTKKIIPLAVIFLLLVVSLFANYASASLLHSNLDPVNKNLTRDTDPSHKYLSDDEVDKLLNSEEAKQNALKTATRIEDAWKDIKNTYLIDENQYIKIDKDLAGNKFISKSPIFSDQSLCMAIYDAMMEYRKNLQVGDLAPNVLVENDGSEIIVAYKDRDNNNVLLKSSKKDSSWLKEDKKTVKGNPILDVGETVEERASLGLPPLKKN